MRAQVGPPQKSRRVFPRIVGGPNTPPPPPASPSPPAPVSSLPSTPQLSLGRKLHTHCDHHVLWVVCREDEVSLSATEEERAVLDWFNGQQPAPTAGVTTHVFSSVYLAYRCREVAASVAAVDHADFWTRLAQRELPTDATLIVLPRRATLPHVGPQRTEALGLLRELQATRRVRFVPGLSEWDVLADKAALYEHMCHILPRTFALDGGGEVHLAPVPTTLLPASELEAVLSAKDGSLFAPYVEALAQQCAQCAPVVGRALRAQGGGYTVIGDTAAEAVDAGGAPLVDAVARAAGAAPGADLLLQPLVAARRAVAHHVCLLGPPDGGGHVWLADVSSRGHELMPAGCVTEALGGAARPAVVRRRDKHEALCEAARVVRRAIVHGREEDFATCAEAFLCVGLAWLDVGPAHDVLVLVDDVELFRGARGCGAACGGAAA
eukprot:TRINITY_DN2503_c1_g1_i2.p1 TRINITY_DN2503_c1_g1~~TRINITY_DN2503_c1_g1_i2.p1  ORF type:complete len:437 (+),score=108.61 TRINITY_DN2503_c1_g1_i2:636-1946(+)